MSQNADAQKFYVYAYLNPFEPGRYLCEPYEFDFRPFYVGKGQGDRINDHLREADGILPVTNKRKVKSIREIIDDGEFPYIVKVAEGLSNNEALAIEKRLIETFGIADRGGILSNIAGGAEGFAWRSTTIQFVYDILRRERSRLHSIIGEMDDQMEQYPMGALQIKARGNQDYYYLAKRDGEKVRFNYVGKAGTVKAEAVRQSIQQRDSLAAHRKLVSSEHQEICKLMYMIEVSMEVPTDAGTAS